MTPSELDLAAIAQVAAILRSEGVTREAAAWEEGRVPGTTRWGMHHVQRRPVLVQGQGQLWVAR